MKIIIMIFVLCFSIQCNAKKIGLINTDIPVKVDIPIDAKADVEGSINKHEKTIISDTVSITEKNKTENTIAKVELKKETINTAENLTQISGVLGIDILYLLSGIGILFSILMLVVFFMMKKIIRLSRKYNEKHLLRASINQIKYKSKQHCEVCDEIICQYDIFKEMLNFK